MQKSAVYYEVVQMSKSWKNGRICHDMMKLSR